MAINFTSENLYFPPTTDKSGISRTTKDIKEIVTFEKNIFTDNVIFMSDIHSHMASVLDYLLANYNLSNYVVITLGDMYGDMYYGSDGDPTQYYKILHEHAKALYIVQGNHDLPPENISELLNLTNKDNSRCLLHNGKIIQTSIGRIGGVHGIISDKKHPYKMPENEYIKFLKNLSGVDILLTHDTPSIVNSEGKKLIGNDAITETIKKYVKPKIHVYGHCYHSPVNKNGNVLYLNADSKVLIFTG
jgi:predicted phosphodiesterase